MYQYSVYKCNVKGLWVSASLYIISVMCVLSEGNLGL